MPRPAFTRRFLFESGACMCLTFAAMSSATPEPPVPTSSATPVPPVGGVPTVFKMAGVPKAFYYFFNHPEFEKFATDFIAERWPLRPRGPFLAAFEGNQGTSFLPPEFPEAEVARMARRSGEMYALLASCSGGIPTYAGPARIQTFVEISGKPTVGLLTSLGAALHNRDRVAWLVVYPEHWNYQPAFLTGRSAAVSLKAGSLPLPLVDWSPEVRREGVLRFKQLVRGDMPSMFSEATLPVVKWAGTLRAEQAAGLASFIERSPRAAAELGWLRTILRRAPKIP